MINKVFILGNHIQALGLCRQISNYGVDVILFTNTKHSISRYSNSVKKSIIFKNEDELLIKITTLKENSKTILLFPTNDQMVAFLSTNYNYLSESFYIGIPEPKTVDIFANKRNTYRFAAENSIPIPESYFPENMSELKILSDKLTYPVIIKPAIMHSFHKIFRKKAFKCNNKKELIERTIQITERFPIEELIIQEFLDGGAKTLFSYGTFAVKGKPIASIMANRIRQNPMDFGNSTTYAVTCNIPKIKEQAEKILNLTNYFGLAEVEFMYDAKTKQYKFLEINTRAWKWHSISNGLGFSFIGKMIAFLDTGDKTEMKEFDKEVAWVERLTDIAVIIKELFHGNFIITTALKSYKIKKVYAVWSLEDLKPFIMYILFSPVLFLKRH